MRFCIPCALLLFLTNLGWAQTDGYRFFQKGNTYFSINQQIDWGFFNQKFDGEDGGNLNQFNSNLNWNRALTDNVGVGATDEAQRSVSKNDDFDFKNVITSYEFGVGGAYAFDLGGRQLIADGKVGFGRVKSVTENGTAEIEDKDDLFSIRGRVGMPLQLYDSELHLVPYVGYEFDKRSADETDFKDNVAVFGLDLYSSIPCNGWWFNEGYEPNKQFRYTSGTQMWGNGTWLKGQFGTETVDTGGFGEFKTNVAGVALGTNYSYYIQERLALGVRAGFDWSRTSPKDFDGKTTFTAISVAPLVRWHPFGSESGADYYLEGSAGFLTSKGTVDPGSGSSSESKLNGFTAQAGVGKFIYLNEVLSVNSFVGYSCQSTKDPDDTDDRKLVTEGVQFRFGLNYSF